jgi:sterol desaturase/sphingolipid hydroxylase (fatty acid hydroxylase superfamily)
MDSLNQGAAALGQTVLRLFLETGSRTYWPFLIAGLAIAACAGWRARNVKLTPAERLLSRETWLGRSAVNDYGLILVNALLMVLVFQYIKLDIAATTSAVRDALPPLAGKSSAWAPFAFAAALFVVDDFVRFFTHYCEHRVPALWELHKVHHSAEVLNFMTAERHHPLSLLVFQSLASLGVVAVNAGFILLVPGHISAAALLGGNAFWVATNLIGGVLRHSPVWISFGPRVERWLISPAQHQIHHSHAPEHFDRNFGGSLAVWDRMFGTLYLTTAERERIRYGLGEETQNYSSLGSLYLRPLSAIMRLFRKPSAHPVAA